MSSETDRLTKDDNVDIIEMDSSEEDSSEEGSSEEESSYESGSEYETDSEEEEEEEREAPAEAEDDDADGMALLLQARRRMQELRAKDKIENKEDSEESDDEENDSDDDEEDNSEDSEGVISKGEKDLKHDVEEGVEGMALDGREKDLSNRSLPRSSSKKNEDGPPIQVQWSSPSRGIENNNSSRSLLEPAENNDSNMTSLRRNQRNENAELWELLRHSQNRVAQTKDLVEKVEKQEKQELEEAAGVEKAIDVEEDNDVDTTAVTSSITSDSIKAADASANDNDSTFQTEDEKKCEDDVERDFEQENRELFELLQQSKQRLEEAARKKIEEAEKEAAMDGETVPAKENPYKDLNNLPDVIEEQADDEDLTQKELLIAMAVAEEAARSGKGDFVTPPKEVLRSRDLASFDFLKEEPSADAPEPQTPEDVTLEEEKSRMRALYNTLSTRWASFKERAKQIDREQHYINLKRRANMINKSRQIMMSGIRQQLTG